MAHISLIEIAREKAGTLVLSGLLLAALGFVSLFFFGARYEVRTDFLVSQEEAGTKDYYTLARSSEYMGKLLGEVVYSERFIAAVVDTGRVNSEFLPFDKNVRLKEWQRMVKVRRELDLGIIKVTVLGDNVKDAQKVSQAISQVLSEKNGQFLGTGDKNISVSILSGPIAERNPSLKEIVSVMAGGFIFGILLAMLFFFARSEVLRERRLQYEQ